MPAFLQISGKSVPGNRSGGKGRPHPLRRPNHTVIKHSTRLRIPASLHCSYVTVITSSYCHLEQRFLLLDSTFHHLKFSSLKMWTFATLCVPQITYPGHIPCNKILLISTTPCFQAPNSFKMLRRMLLFY